MDVLRDEGVRVYSANNPEHPQIYRCGEMAEAENALPGWLMAVDDLFV